MKKVIGNVEYELASADEFKVYGLYMMMADGHSYIYPGGVFSVTRVGGNDNAMIGENCGVGVSRLRDKGVMEIISQKDITSKNQELSKGHLPEKAYFYIGNDPGCSERVQKRLFELGCKWCHGGQQVMSAFASHLYVDLHGSCPKEITWSNGSSWAKGICKENYQEVNIDFLRTPKETPKTYNFNGENLTDDEIEEKVKEAQETLETINRLRKEG